MTSVHRQEGQSGIFICYRRGETTGHARAVKDRLEQHFTPGHRIFMDVDSIGVGVAFGKAIGDAICSSGVMLVLIGGDWSGRLLAENRLDDPADYVRLEIETALQRGIPTIPVLIERTPIPERGKLPESLRELVSYEGIDLENRHWNDDMSRMTQALESILGGSTSSPPAVPSGANLLVLGPIALSVPLLIFALNYVFHYNGWVWQALIATAAIAALVTAREYRRSRIWVIALEWNCFWFLLFGIYRLKIYSVVPSPHWKTTAAVTAAGAIVNAFFFIPTLISVLRKKRVVHPIVPGFLGLMAIGLGVGAVAHFPHHYDLYTNGAQVLFVALAVNLLAPFLALAQKLSGRSAARSTQINQPPRRVPGDQTSQSSAWYGRRSPQATGTDDRGEEPGFGPLPPRKS